MELNGAIRPQQIQLIQRIYRLACVVERAGSKQRTRLASRELRKLNDCKAVIALGLMASRARRPIPGLACAVQNPAATKSQATSLVATFSGWLALRCWERSEGLRQRAGW